MAKKVSDYKKDIEKALKAANSYNKSLDMQIQALASAMRTLDLANDDIDGLESTTVLECTRYGSKHAPHPVFKIQKDAQDSVTRQMKALGLTAADLAGEIEDDPLVDLTKKVKNASRRKPNIVRKDSKE
jgi:hypothetical protein